MLLPASSAQHPSCLTQWGPDFWPRLPLLPLFSASWCRTQPQHRSCSGRKNLKCHVAAESRRGQGNPWAWTVTAAHTGSESSKLFSIQENNLYVSRNTKDAPRLACEWMCLVCFARAGQVLVGVLRPTQEQKAMLTCWSGVSHASAPPPPTPTP